jgi:hypothetical protein
LSSLIGIFRAAVYEIRQFFRIEGARCSFFAQVIVNGLLLDHRILSVVICMIYETSRKYLRTPVVVFFQLNFDLPMYYLS